MHVQSNVYILVALLDTEMCVEIFLEHHVSMVDYLYLCKKKRIAVDHTVMYYVTARTIIIFIVCISINNERMPGLIVIYVFVLC